MNESEEFENLEHFADALFANLKAKGMAPKRSGFEIHVKGKEEAILKHVPPSKRFYVAIQAMMKQSTKGKSFKTDYRVLTPAEVTGELRVDFNEREAQAGRMMPASGY